MRGCPQCLPNHQFSAPLASTGKTIAPRALKREWPLSISANDGLTGGERHPMMPAVETRLALPLAIFAFTYLVFVIGKFPRLQLDRTGAALAVPPPNVRTASAPA